MISLILAAALQALPALTTPEQNAMTCIQSVDWQIKSDSSNYRKYERGYEEIVAFYIGRLSAIDPSKKWADLPVREMASATSSSKYKFDACHAEFYRYFYPTPLPLPEGPAVVVDIAPPTALK